MLPLILYLSEYECGAIIQFIPHKVLNNTQKKYIMLSAERMICVIKIHLVIRFVVVDL